MQSKKNRIGLVLASIHTGAGQNVWPSFAGTALVEDRDLFIFPGGRLNARTDSENLRNSVYSLANSENLDGCISWSSSIRYTEPAEEFERFHSGFDLPYVTLNYKSSGHPCVEFDSYTGMKLLTSHCINVHNAKKIAFIQGPDFHESAHLRLRGFLDALGEAGLPVPRNNPLISDPFNWSNGDAAAAQLFENRKLMPGRDFDTLVCSSDLMALGAVGYLEGKGCHVPSDYHAAGFNNSIESRLTESPLSTVDIPYTALSLESFRILMQLLEKKGNRQAGNSRTAPPDPEDILLPTDIIIRESCGCMGMPNLPAKKMYPRGSQENSGGRNAEETLTGIIADYLKLSPPDASALVAPVIHSLFDRPEQVFFSILEKALVRYFSSGRDTELLLKLTEDIAGSRLVPAALVRRLQPSLYRTIFRVQERLAIHSRYEKENRNTALNSLKCELLGTRDRKSLVQSLARHLPKIGIHTAGIALYRDDKTTLWVGSFSPEGISGAREQSFPAGRLVPKSLESGFSHGVFLVQPLFIENQSLGYFVHTVPFYDGVVYEELRSAVSYALKGIFQFDELVRAKSIAEQAERTKTEFLRTLENELYDPLAGIMERVDKLAVSVSAGMGIAYGVKLEELKSYVASREERTENLVDLALSRIDESDLKKSLFNPEELFPEIASVKTRDMFPLLCGDSFKLSQCFSLIREEYSDDFSAAVTYGGLELVFKRAAVPSKEKEPKRKERMLLLSERIVLMHGGEFKKTGSACTVTLPWPDLYGNAVPIRKPGRQEHILSLSGFVCAGLPDLPVISDSEMTAGGSTGGNPAWGRTAFIIWNSGAAGSKDLLGVSSFRRRAELRDAAFLCYGSELIGEESVIDGVEKLIRSPKRTLLSIGGEQNLLPKLGGDEIHISSMPFFNETVSVISPHLILCNSISSESIAAIRRHPITVTVPVVMTDERIDSAADVMVLSQYSRLMLCHRCIASSPEFQARLQNVLAGAEILPPHTGALVKKTIHYFDQNFQSYITRWRLAESVNVNEDYLTRIFHQEMGMSLWDYLNRFRVHFAAGLLRQTDESIQEIASRSGFQDHAYFSRVFRRIYGVPPGQIRKKSE